MLEKICTNLKTSKRLKELGFEAETNFLYTPTEITASKDKKLELQYWATTECIVWKKDSLIPAYTLEQIINELPRNIVISQIVYDLSIDHHDFGYHNTLFKKTYIQFSKQNNLATTAAKLWIKLKEDKII